MTYQEALDLIISAFRLDYDPVGILFVSTEDTPEDLPQTHKTRNKLTFCQYLAAVRQGRYALFMEKEKLLCRNAEICFGFREVEGDTDQKVHRKYLLDPELSLQAAKDKAHLPLNRYQGVYLAPLPAFDALNRTPDIVHMLVQPFQGYHVLNDYMGAMGKTCLNFCHTPNSAVCGGSVWALQQQTANMNTMCAGSKASGKTEMAYMNLAIPGSQFLPTMAQLIRRKEKNGGTSLVGRGNHDWPGLDACQGCPLFRFDPISKD